ncbi:hypothetical protein PGT21_009800 [Puccinia graminis f. sp. tritici]|uniref:Uncharacterized protein n=1 Tax=Puccinia graminis f. sp. tritici TaxID=56615 RepID=A0A5B0MAM1_PUCGR|nr:hypothetical protein PGT21_009800 [Puccinia graminis f. sp. tritici]
MTAHKVYSGLESRNDRSIDSSQEGTMEGMTTPPHLRTFAVTGDGVCITQSCHLQGLSENREDGCCNSFSVPKNVHPHEAQSLALSQWQFASWFHKVSYRRRPDLINFNPN